MGSVLIGMGLGLMTAAALLTAGLGIGLAFVGYVLGGVLGTLGSAGWAVLRVPEPRQTADRRASPMSLQLD